MNNRTLIAISRQFGSGGKEIAEIVAKKLGIRCYDRQILYLAAEKIGDGTLDAQSILNDAYRVAGSTFASFGQTGITAATHYNRLYKEQAKLILDIARREDAVFLGRCADVILKDNPDCISVFVYADSDFRAERAKTVYDNKTLKQLNAEDTARKNYYKYYTGQMWGDPKNYDLMINTSHYSLEDAADLIIYYMNQKNKKKLLTSRL